MKVWTLFVDGGDELASTVNVFRTEEGAYASLAHEWPIGEALAGKALLEAVQEEYAVSVYITEHEI